MKRISFVALATALVFVSACASSGGGSKGDAVAAPPASFTGFPKLAVVGIVVAEAKFYTNYETIFGNDLIDDEDVIPIAVKVGLQGAGQEISRVSLASQATDWRLYLQDGTALTSVPYERVAAGSKKVAERVIARAFKQTLLGKWADSKESFVFFKLAPASDFDVKGADIRHKDGASMRHLDLSCSLVSFSVNIEGDDVPIYVGVQRDVQGTNN